MSSRPFRFGVVTARAQSGDEWVTKARRIEQLGYSTLLMPDRLSGPLFSPLPALDVAASVTHSLRVGTFVLAVGFRNPLLLARECATLDFLSGGRFELGLGAGVGEEVNHSGKHYTVKGARGWPPPTGGSGWRGAAVAERCPAGTLRDEGRSERAYPGRVALRSRRYR